MFIWGRSVPLNPAAAAAAAVFSPVTAEWLMGICPDLRSLPLCRPDRWERALAPIISQTSHTCHRRRDPGPIPPASHCLSTPPPAGCGTLSTQFSPFQGDLPPPPAAHTGKYVVGSHSATGIEVISRSTHVDNMQKALDALFCIQNCFDLTVNLPTTHQNVPSPLRASLSLIELK